MIGTTAKLETTAGPLQWNPSQSTDVWALAHRIQQFHPEGGARSLVAVILHFHVLLLGFLEGSRTHISVI